MKYYQSIDRFDNSDIEIFAPSPKSLFKEQFH